MNCSLVALNYTSQTEAHLDLRLHICIIVTFKVNTDKRRQTLEKHLSGFDFIYSRCSQVKIDLDLRFPFIQGCGSAFKQVFGFVIQLFSVS